MHWAVALMLRWIPSMWLMATMLSGMAKTMAIARSRLWTANASSAALSASDLSSLMTWYPAPVMASAMRSSVTTESSYTTVAVLFPMLALQDATPSSASTAVFMRFEHAAQLIPPTRNMRVLIGTVRA